MAGRHDKREEEGDLAMPELSHEVEARDYELRVRSPEDVARYGTMLSDVQENYDERLNSYLNNEHNLKLYYELKRNSWGGLFDQLEFFRILDSLHRFIQANSSKPRAIEKRLRELEYSQQQNYRLLESLTKRLIWESEEDSSKRAPAMVCREETIRLWQAMNWESIERSDAEFHFFNVYLLQQHIERLPTSRDRLKYLVRLKASLKQLSNPDQPPPFLWQIDSEIEKLQTLEALDVEAAVTGKRMKGGSHHQTLHAIHYLLTLLDAKDINTRKARFGEFLTGFSENTLRQGLQNILKEPENFIAWETDMKSVREHFEQLGLTDAVNLINNDLESQTE